jgi:hypothetical protein
MLRVTATYIVNLSRFDGVRVVYVKKKNPHQTDPDKTRYELVAVRGDEHFPLGRLKDLGAAGEAMNDITYGLTHCFGVIELQKHMVEAYEILTLEEP